MTDRVTITQDEVNQPEPEIPEWVDQQFHDQEDPIAAQAKAWAESQREDEVPEEAPEDSDSPTDSPADAPGGDFQVAADSLREAVESDSVEDKHFEAFEKLGVPRYFVEQYLAATAQVGEAMANEIYSVAGGQEDYTKMMEWASKSIDLSEQEMFNRVMSGDDQQLKKKMVSSLYDAYQKAAKPTKNVKGKPSSDAPLSPYTSIAEMMDDVSSMRYHQDKHFREQVKQRQAISNL